MSQTTIMLSYLNTKVDRDFYRSCYDKSMFAFDEKCPNGYSVNIDDEGIRINANGLLMHIRKCQIICYVCGTSVKNHMKNNCDIGLAHLEQCHEEFVASLVRDICTVCEKHWLFNKSAFHQNNYNHVTCPKHQQYMMIAKEKNYYHFKDRLAHDREIIENEDARKFLANSLTDKKILDNYIRASIEIIMDAPDYSTDGGEFAEQKNALASQLGAINHRTIIDIMKALEVHHIKAEDIYAETYGTLAEEFDGPSV